MLIEFSVENYLSFKDLATLSMLPASIKELDENIINSPNYDLLKSAVIFGANASGKSNFFKAMVFARSFILNSSKSTQIGEKIHVTPFLLSTKTQDSPSFFEFIFLKDNVKYRYGFRVNKTEVIDEWLFQAEKIKESTLFTRHLQDFKISNKFKEGSKLTKFVRNNVLFLSLVAQFNGEIAKNILNWFFNFNIISGLQKYEPISLKFLKNPESKEQFLDVFKTADFSIEDFDIEEKDIANAPKFIQEQIEEAKKTGLDLKILPDIKTVHKKFDENNEVVDYVKFNLDTNGSEGTKHMFSLLGPILDTLSKNKVLIIDELEASLHPLISRFLVQLFHKKNCNAQFIFNTHDTNLLSKKYFRRDQIYFTEKDKFGSSKLYSLYDYKVRNDRNYDKDYLNGIYGAVPFIDDLDFFDNEQE